MIIPLSIKHIDECLELGKLLHSESIQRSTNYSPEHVKQFLYSVLLDKYGKSGFVYIKDNKIVGAIISKVDSQFWSPDKVAENIVLFVHPEYRGGLIAYRLIQRFEQWAKDMGAVRTDLTQGSGINVEKTTRLFSKLGYSLTGNSLSKEI